MPSLTRSSDYASVLALFGSANIARTRDNLESMVRDLVNGTVSKDAYSTGMEQVNEFVTLFRGKSETPDLALSISHVWSSINTLMGNQAALLLKLSVRSKRSSKTSLDARRPAESSSPVSALDTAAAKVKSIEKAPLKFLATAMKLGE